MQTVQSLIQSRSQDKFSLTIDTFYYIHFFRKVNENPKTKKIASLITTALNGTLITRQAKL